MTGGPEAGSPADLISVSTRISSALEEIPTQAFTHIVTECFGVPRSLAHLPTSDSWNTSFALLFLESRSAVKPGVAEFSAVLSRRRPDKPFLPARRPCG